MADFNVSGVDEHGEIDGEYKSMTGAHPVWSNELVETINASRKWGNSKEDELKGEIQESTFASMSKAELQTKFPADLLAYMIDWDNDITSGGGDAMGTAMKGIGYVNGLRQIFGRDPMHGEILAAHAMGGAGMVKQLYDLAQQKPEEIAEPMGGGKKQNVVYKKLRNGKEVKRTNREVYDFFMRRIANGRLSFKKNVGSTDGINSLFGDMNLSSLTSSLSGGMGSMGGLSSMFSSFSGTTGESALNTSNPLTEAGLNDPNNTDLISGLTNFASLKGGDEKGSDTSGEDSRVTKEG